MKTVKIYETYENKKVKKKNGFEEKFRIFIIKSLFYNEIKNPRVICLKNKLKWEKQKSNYRTGF